MDVIVVGAGIAGLSAAHALVQAGARVTVVAPGGGQSARGAGIVSAQFRDPGLAALALRSQAIVRDLVEVRECGLAQLALSKAAAASLEGVPAACDRLPAELERRFARPFRRRLVRAMFEPRDFWLDGAELLCALESGSRRVRARALSVAPHRIDYEGGSVEGDAVVIARGPGGPLARASAPRRTLRRALLARAPIAFPSMFHVVDTKIYARPDRDGMLVGDGDRLWRGRNPGTAVRPDAAFLWRIRGELSEMFGVSVSCRGAGGGVIDKSEDDRPFVERQAGILVMGGLGGDGFALAPALGERIARALASDPAGPIWAADREAADLAAALDRAGSSGPC